MRKETLRFGVIGTNNITDTVLEGAMLDPRFQLTAVYSRTDEQAKLFAAKYNAPYTFTSLDQMAKSDTIDAVYIASPNSLHASQSILFMQHGKHVLCEKPFASNACEVKEMIAASQKYNVTLMEAMKPSLTPNFKAVIDHIHSIGTIRRYSSSFCLYSSRYDKYKEGEILNAFKLELSNGSTMDMGVYTIYPMVVLLGKPNKIIASGLKMSTGVDSQAGVLFEYDGMNASVIYSKIVHSDLPTEIQGEEGTITLDKINIIGDVTLKMRKTGESNTISRPVDTHEYYYEVAEFINLVQSDKRESEINSHANSLIVIEILDEIRRQLGVVYPADKKV